MAKYGSGVSMRNVILNERKTVTEILAKSGLSSEDRQRVLDAFEEMAYQWCKSNAMCCAIEDAFERKVGRLEIGSAVMLGMLSEKKLRETYPEREGE